MRKLTVLGSTGSIGTNTLDVVRKNRHRYEVYALAAGRNVELLTAQILEFHPAVVVVPDSERLELLRSELLLQHVSQADWPELAAGDQARVEAATASEADTVISAIVGVAGLEATYAAARAGKRIGLANKEVLVASGKLMMDAVRESGAELIPVDSEHNGAHQCLRAGRGGLRRLILTASGGPFRNTPREELASVTPAEALQHPTWKMGNRITIDSATLMNKGFEVIEACWLFDLSPAQVDVVIHPQSSVHAMIEYTDGSILAQISATDMRMPIQYALTWPDRFEAPVPKINWLEPRQWDFGPPDLSRFPLLELAYECQQAGGTATCILNAADEIAVEAFLNGKISFPAIAEVVQETLSRQPSREAHTIQEVLEVDRDARAKAREILSRRPARSLQAAPAAD